MQKKKYIYLFGGFMSKYIIYTIQIYAYRNIIIINIVYIVNLVISESKYKHY
jgi:hypothetical protein